MLAQYGETVTPPRTGKRGRPQSPQTLWPKGSAYATVKKTYAKGTVTAVKRKLVHGTRADLDTALRQSSSSTKINTSFVERQNGTDRTYNARKARKTCQFSKDLLVHMAVTWWVFFCYNFHHINRGLRLKNADGTFIHRTPAMAIGIAQAPLTVPTILMTQVVGSRTNPIMTLAIFHRSHVARPAP